MSDDTPLFNAKQQALEKAYQTCPNCGQHLVMKNGKAGAFIGCSQYPTCSYTRALHPEHDDFEAKEIPGSQCPKCASPLAIKNGRYGMFIGCTNFPACHHIEHEHDPVNEKHVPCPKCVGGELKHRTSRYGKSFYACDQYPKCKYLVNFKPVAQSCPDCAWPILVEKSTRGVKRLVCPQKGCQYKQDIASETL
ncbi:hypothetical protein C2869_08465 [Saccharobesus litoralis]|uniref:DNA topoisomerase type IA zn finger domain-containing protein n=1 Tax=Saccharobesus litoralis TaxID=2172099 RepID=A0A2S0VQG3_9ALTE|nr:type I DNA topoisomerase [Saccharobesus litoralis]AWB66457.1 hypothetical protein C2869_08465 [Saccharobesus litoralis]